MYLANPPGARYLGFQHFTFMHNSGLVHSRPGCPRGQLIICPMTHGHNLYFLLLARQEGGSSAENPQSWFKDHFLGCWVKAVGIQTCSLRVGRKQIRQSLGITAEADRKRFKQWIKVKPWCALSGWALTSLDVLLYLRACLRSGAGWTCTCIQLDTLPSSSPYENNP